MTTGGQTHHLFGSDGTYHNAGGITFGDDTTQTSAGVTSATTGITGAAAITNIVKITQTGYNALTTKDPATVYYIVSG
jgi:NaMN:DMB phosphoribosyltransferase